MKFFAIHIEDLESDKFIASTPDQITTWLYLHAYCCKQLNGGRIAGAAGLDPRVWARLGVDSGTLDAPSRLWSWDGDDLVIHPYDSEGQTVYERKVAGGKARAAARWGSTPGRTPISTPGRTPNAPESTRDNPTQEETSSLFALNGASSVSSQKMAWSASTGFSGISGADRESWATAYPAVNIDRQLAAAHEWLLSNPAKAHKSQWRRFITGWLSRAQERGGDIPSNPAASRNLTSANGAAVTGGRTYVQKP